MTAIAIIPARGGSRRIPRKNIRLFHGKPIIAYSIAAAWDSGLFENVIVSSDDDEILEIAERYCAKKHSRSADLAVDSVGTLAVTGAVARTLPAHIEHVCCIYPTAPMLLPHDLVRGHLSLKHADAVHCVSVGTEPLRDAAQFYWSSIAEAKSECPYYHYSTVVEPIAECRICDINTEDDWQRAERMYAELHKVPA